MQPPWIQALVQLADGFFTLVHVKVFPVVQQKVPVPTVNAVGLVAKEKVVALVAVLAQKDHLACHEG